MADMVSKEQAGRLLRLARESIRERLEGGAASEVVCDDLYEPGATFVTLKINGQLRGCIGNLEPAGTIPESIRRNAVSAAFHDSRFEPLSVEEYARVHIDISILTRPQVLVYRDAEDLVEKLVPGQDGVVLRHGRAGATFLPQVWEQLPTVSLFLGHLCRKAGLPESCWKTDHPEIQTYRVQYFKEEE